MNSLNKVIHPKPKDDLDTVEYLDIYRFLGDWYEVAKIGKFYDGKLTNVKLNY